MEKRIRQFIFKTILLTIIIAAVSVVVFYFLIPKNYFAEFPFILLMFPIVSILIHIQLLKSSQKSLPKFNIAFMLSFLIKLLVYLGVSATILSLEIENRTTFILTVLILYVIYTVFDVSNILKDMKKLDLEASENESKS